MTVISAIAIVIYFYSIEMSDISEKDWKLALIAILEELEDEQFRKMLFKLDEVPRSKKKLEFREQTAQTILERYGLEKSISAINEAIAWIPRRDAPVQDLLRPFVDKLKNKHENGHKVLKRKNDSVEEEEMSSTGLKRRKDSVEEEEMSLTDQQKSCQPDKATNAGPWKFICDLKTSSELCDTDYIKVKVVAKSALRTYYTKDKVKRFFFNLAIADQTGTIKIMVYGRERYKKINEGKSYYFTELIRDEISIKVIAQSKVSDTKTVEVSEEHEMQGRKLIYPEAPLCTIKEAKSFADKTEVSVHGTVTKIDPIRHQKEKVNVQDFHLQDETGTIKISMWRDNTKQCKVLLVGDIIKITNMKINKYFNDTSLNSTGFTKIQKVQSVAVQNVKIEIIGIDKATKKETHLDAMVNELPHRLVVGSQLLAKAFGLSLDNLKESLLEKLPLFADAVIHGSKIKKITAVAGQL